jgi:hypothetical protein
MWYQHALHQPGDYVAHEVSRTGPQNFYFSQRINLTIDALILNW